MMASQQCMRCGKYNPAEIHTCTPKAWESKCCNDRVQLACGKKLYDPLKDYFNLPANKACYWVCMKCEEACDVN